MKLYNLLVCKDQMKQECKGKDECRIQGNPCIYQVLCQRPDLLNLQCVYSFLEYMVSKKQIELLNRPLRL